MDSQGIKQNLKYSSRLSSSESPDAPRPFSALSYNKSSFHPPPFIKNFPINSNRLNSESLNFKSRAEISDVLKSREAQTRKEIEGLMRDRLNEPKAVDTLFRDKTLDSEGDFRSKAKESRASSVTNEISNLPISHAPSHQISGLIGAKDLCKIQLSSMHSGDNAEPERPEKLMSSKFIKITDNTFIRFYDPETKNVVKCVECNKMMKESDSTSHECANKIREFDGIQFLSVSNGLYVCLTCNTPKSTLFLAAHAAQHNAEKDKKQRSSTSSACNSSISSESSARPEVAENSSLSSTSTKNEATISSLSSHLSSREDSKPTSNISPTNSSTYTPQILPLIKESNGLEFRIQVPNSFNLGTGKQGNAYLATSSQIDGELVKRLGFEKVNQAEIVNRGKRDREKFEVKDLIRKYRKVQHCLNILAVVSERVRNVTTRRTFRKWKLRN
jgi:hypothetical protein